MSLPLRLWLAIALACATAHAESEPAEAAFSRELTTAEWRSPAWSDAQDALDLYECVTVRSLRTIPAPDSILVLLDAIGTQANSVQRALPERWFLTVRDGRIEQVATEAMWLAAQLRIDGGERNASLLDATSSRTLAEAVRSVTRRSDCRRSPASCAPIFQQILNVAKKRDDAVSATHALCALAHAEQNVDLLDDARRFAEASGNRDAIALVDLTAARLTTDVDRKNQLFARAARAIDLLENPRLALEALKEQADLAFDGFQIKEAFRLYTELVESSRRIGWSRGAMLGLYGNARVKASVRDFEGARLHSTQSAELARRLGDAEVEARALNLSGQTYTFDGNVHAAIPILTEALAIIPAESFALISVIHTNLAKCYNRLHKWKLVELHVQRAVEAAEAANAPRLATMTYEFAASTARDCRQAIAFARRGMQSQKGGQLWTVWSLKARLGQGLMACGEQEAGVRELYESIDLIEARRALTPTSEFERASYFAGHVWAYQALVSALVDVGRCEEALAIADQMRARWLTDKLAADIPSHLLGATDEARQRALNERIVELNRARLIEPLETERLSAELSAMRSDLQRFATELALRHPQLQYAAPFDAAFTLGDLSSDSAAIEFVVTGHTIIAFVVRSSGVSAVRLPGSGLEIIALARSFARKIATRDPVYTADAGTLYLRLFEPLRTALTGVRKLVVVADDALWLIPFEALRPSPGTFLADRYEIEYRLSLASRHRTPEAGPGANAKLLVLASPARASLPDLPDAAREAQRIAEFYGSSRADVYQGSEAQEALLKKDASRYGIIHFATHGLPDGPSPMFSSLLLATSRGDSEDGLLEAREVARLSLNAEVVVLGACQTAGEVMPGEGLIGLSWSFLAAGAAKVVVTRWNAESRATSRLMIEFHRNLARGDKTVGAALRAARDKLRGQPRYQHPFYWAPFVIIGS